VIDVRLAVSECIVIFKIVFSYIMLTKVEVAKNAFERALVILNLYYLQMRKENHMFER